MEKLSNHTLESLKKRPIQSNPKVKSDLSKDTHGTPQMATRISGAPRGKLSGKMFAQKDLTLEVRNQMWTLYSFYYESATYETFMQDLSEKSHVCLLTDAGDKTVKGFSTIIVYKKEFNKNQFTVIFSGDTIVDAQYWGQKTLSVEMFKFFMKIKLQNPLTPVYWFLISKGYKTYLGMTRNFVNYWPRYDKKTSKSKADIIDCLARDRYGESWKPALGLLKFEKCPGKLKSSVAPIDHHLLRDPDIKFFSQKNPNHSEGDELCCLAEVNFILVLYFPLRMIKKISRKAFRKVKQGSRQQAVFNR